MEQLSIWCILFAMSCGGNQSSTAQLQHTSNHQREARVAMSQLRRSNAKKVGKAVFEYKSSKPQHHHKNKPQPLNDM